ncbi:MAG: hypothetical protein QM642_04945 [Edaphocola sp.]
MKKILLFIALMFFAYNSNADATIATIQPDGTYAIVVPDDNLNVLFKNVFANSSTSSYTITAEDGKFYVNSNDEKTIYRIELHQNGTNLELLSMVAGESCNGDPCSKCSFASGGGCSCSGILNGKCNHSISRVALEQAYPF